MTKPSPTGLRVLAAAVGAVLAASLVRAFCHAVFNETIPYTPFYPAIVLVTIYGGLRGGLLSLVLAAFAASFWLIPFGRPMITEPADTVGLALFAVVGGIVVALCEGMRRAQAQAEVAAAERQAALGRERRARAKAEEAIRLKDEFLASVSHELRTPLQSILGWAEMLRIDLHDEDALREGLAHIAHSAEAQAHLIEDLLDVGRLIAGKMRLSMATVNLRTVAESAIRTVTPAAQAKAIQIERSFADDACTLWADPDRLQQIMWNLLSNAIKFSPPGSTIRITLDRDGANLRLQVIDEGCGLDPEFAPYIFERFSQADGSKSRRFGGLGLGLSIVKGLVELHGGTVAAISGGVGQGTTMTVALPDTGRTPAADLRTSSRQSGRLFGIRVLVVDDDPETCELVRRILREQEATVTAVSSPDEALLAAERDKPDVIISDIAMPGRDGYELLREIRSRCGLRRVPAMALTGYCAASDRFQSFEAGFALHLTKPIHAGRLTEAVEELAGTQA